MWGRTISEDLFPCAKAGGWQVRAHGGTGDACGDKPDKGVFSHGDNLTLGRGQKRGRQEPMELSKGLSEIKGNVQEQDLDEEATG